MRQLSEAEHENLLKCQRDLERIFAWMEAMGMSPEKALQKAYERIWLPQGKIPQGAGDTPLPASEEPWKDGETWRFVDGKKVYRNYEAYVEG